MSQSSTLKDTLIISSIIFVLVAVFLVFYTEIIKKNKIQNAKKNFYAVKEELLQEINKCKDKKQSWIFGISCEQKPTMKIISDYYNKSKNLTNPYDGYEGVKGTPGSVQIDLKNKLLILSIDVDASGGIDIEHRMNIN